MGIARSTFYDEPIRAADDTAIVAAIAGICDEFEHRRVGRELGVRYVLEGSVRKVGNRVRIMEQTPAGAASVMYKM